MFRKGARRTWHAPAEQSLYHWQQTVTRRHIVGERRRTLIAELGMLARFYTPQWVLIYLKTPAADPRPAPLHIAAQTPRVMDAHLGALPLANLSRAPTGLWQTLRSGGPRAIIRFAHAEWRTTRQPREQSLLYWRRMLTQQHGAEKNRHIVADVTTLFNHGPSGKENLNVYTAQLANDIHADVYIQDALKNYSLPVTRRQTVWAMLTRSKVKHFQSVDVDAFARMLIVQINKNSSVSVALSKSEPDALIASFKRPLLSTFRSHTETAPEHSAWIAIGLITKLVNLRETDELNVIFGLLAGLPLAPSFVDMILKLEATKNNRSITADERFILQLFLRSIGARLTPLSKNVIKGLDLEGIKFSYATVIGSDGLQGEVPDIDVHKTDRWFMSGQIPFGLLGAIAQTRHPDVSIFGPSNLLLASPKKITQVLGSTAPVEIKRMATQRVPLYSNYEDQLSALTASLSKRLIDGFRQLLGPHEAQAWLEALELPLDDLLFGATIDFWSVLTRIKDSPEHADVVVVQTTEMAQAFIAGFRAVGLQHKVTMLGPTIDVPSVQQESVFIRDVLWQAFGGADEQSAAIVSKAARDALVGLDELTADPKEAVLLIGRNFDRNYQTDLAHLGRQLQKNHRVAFVPTAGQRDKNQIFSFFNTMMSDWHDEVIPEPAFALWSPWVRSKTTVRKMTLPVVIQESQAIAPFTLSETALLLYAAPQMNVFFGNRIFNHLRAGSLMAQTVLHTRPRYMALLPGRDYISRVAALAGRQAGIVSFDIQTVFVGPRTRYKTTAADIQFTIETESKKLFQSYFGLPAHKTILTGCEKLGEVQQAARKMDVQETRRSVNMHEKRLLVFACSPFIEEDQLILESLSQSLLVMPNARLGVRLHPTAKPGYPEYVESLVRRNPSILVLDQLDLPQTLIAADILITRFSNVGLEAALLGKDVIACNFNGGIVPIRLDKMGVSAVALSSAELSHCLEDFSRQGPIWDKLQATRAAYIVDNQQLLEPSAAKKIYAEMEKHWRKNTAS